MCNRTLVLKSSVFGVTGHLNATCKLIKKYKLNEIGVYNSSSDSNENKKGHNAEKLRASVGTRDAVRGRMLIGKR